MAGGAGGAVLCSTGYQCLEITASNSGLHTTKKDTNTGNYLPGKQINDAFKVSPNPEPNF